MLTSMQAFELIENNYYCRKSANRPVYKLSVDNNDNNQKKKKNDNKPNDNNDNNQTSFGEVSDILCNEYGFSKAITIPITFIFHSI